MFKKILRYTLLGVLSFNVFTAAVDAASMPDDVKGRLASKIQNKSQSAVQKTAGEDAVIVSNKPTLPAAQKPKAAPAQNGNHSPYYQVKQVPVKTELPTAKKHSKKAKKAAKQPVMEERVYYGGIMLPRDYKDISIFGENVVTKYQAAQYIRQNVPNVKLQCTVEKLVELYYSEAALEGVRGDLALCQAITETGFFRYGGEVNHRQNNFCGLGTTGKGVKGAEFKTPQIGVRAHIQHLLAYSRKARPATKVVDPRYDLAHDIRVQKGLINKWMGLTGTWAMSREYCEKIMSHYVRMQEIKDVSSSSKAGSKDKKKSMRERTKQVLGKR